MMENDKSKIICPDCGAEIMMSENMAIGDVLECSACGTEVEVLSLEPLKYQELLEEK